MHSDSLSTARFPQNFSRSVFLNGIGLARRFAETFHQYINLRRS
jgi:hypothetical protein